MERSQLLYVVEVAKCGNITKAAEVLHLSQPSLSNQIINLEKELGISLFERTRKRVILTEAGEAFVMQATIVLNDLDLLRQNMEDYSLQKLGRLRLGMLSVMVPLGFPELIQAFSKLYPSIEISILESGSFELVNSTKKSEIDVALVIIPDINEVEDLYRIKIMESRLMAAINVNNVLTQNDSINLEMLGDQKLIMTTGNFNLQRLIQSRFVTMEVPYNISAVCNQVETCLALVDKGFGISFCSEDIVDYYKFPNVRYIPMESMPTRKIYMVYKKPLEYHPNLKSFVDFASKYYEIPNATISDMQS